MSGGNFESHLENLSKMTFEISATHIAGLGARLTLNIVDFGGIKFLLDREYSTKMLDWNSGLYRDQSPI